MATTLSLSAIMTAVRQRADMSPALYTPSLTGNTNLFVVDSELIGYINQSLFELYDLLISKYGDNYYVKTPPYQFTTDGSAFYDLPADFYKLIGVDMSVTPGDENWITIHHFEMASRNRATVPNLQAYAGLTNLRYRLSNNSIWFTPKPSAGQRIQLWYLPRMVTLDALSDVTDGISGWTEYVIVDAAIKCLQKEESDVGALFAQKQALVKRIEAMAENRDAGEPMTVSDNRTMNDYYGGDFGGGGWGGVF